MKYFKLVTCGVTFSLIAVCVSAASVGSNTKTGTIPDCSAYTQQQLADLVKKDFLQEKLPAWQAEITALGMSQPVVWIEPNDIKSENDIWSIPLVARGSSTERYYVAKLNCQKGEIVYSQQNTQ